MANKIYEISKVDGSGSKYFVKADSKNSVIKAYINTVMKDTPVDYLTLEYQSKKKSNEASTQIDYLHISEAPNYIEI